MAKLLIISGDLAAGKTTFGEKISSYYSWVILSKDHIKEMLADTIGFVGIQENIKLSRAAVLVMIDIFKRFAKVNKDIILEANFHQHEIEKLQLIAKEYNYQTLTLVLSGDLATIHSRYLKRIATRHKAHLSVDLSDFNDFSNYINKLRKIDYFGKVVNIDATDFSYQDSKSIESLINHY